MTQTIPPLQRRAALALLLGSALPAVAQDKFPARPMEMMVPWGPGGGADTIGRLVARWIESDLGAQMPVVNMPGAQGVVGLSKLLQQPADGHAMGVVTSDTVMSLVLTQTPGRQFKWSDLAPVAVLSRQLSGLFVRTDGRFKSWAELVVEAKAKPGTISVATTGQGSPDDMSVDVLAAKGIRLVAVPFAKPGERYAAVLGGHVDVLFEQAGDIKGHLDAKTLRPVLFFASQRLAAPFADVPLSVESGVEFTMPQLRSVAVRAHTDPKRLALLAASLSRFAQSAEYQNYLRDQLALPDSFIPADKAAAFLAQDIEGMKRVQAMLPSVAASK